MPHNMWRLFFGPEQLRKQTDTHTDRPTLAHRHTEAQTHRGADTRMQAYYIQRKERHTDETGRRTQTSDKVLV